MAEEGMATDLPPVSTDYAQFYSRQSRPVGAAPCAGDFVRFSPRSSDVGVAFPNPLGNLGEARRQVLYPDLPAAALEDREQLASIRPIPIQRRPDGVWVRA